MDSKSAIILSCDLIMSLMQAILEYKSILTYLFPFSYIHTYICNWIQVEGKADFKYLPKFSFWAMKSLGEISYFIFTWVGDQKEDFDMVLREWEQTDRKIMGDYEIHDVIIWTSNHVLYSGKFGMIFSLVFNLVIWQSRRKSPN